MSEQTTIADGVRPASSGHGEDHRWIKCTGCKGDVGIPSDWTESTADCPQCGTAVQVKGGVLYRPPVQSNPLPAQQQPATRTPSLDLNRLADWVMVWGVLSVVLGWTFLTPFFGICVYIDASRMAKKEQVLVPSKATIGLVLCLLFGAGQGLAVILHCCK